MSDSEVLRSNYALVQEKIAMAARKSGRRPEDVLCLPVSKSVSVEKIRMAYAMGLRQFGENYVQELQEKMAHFTELKINDIEWHFIGHLQTNKVKSIADKTVLVHSVDRPSLVQELDKRSQAPQKILIEVNLAGEETKSGVAPEQLDSLIEAVQASEKLQLKGFMFMPPLGISPEDARIYYSKARILADQFSKKLSFPHSAGTLSMGTSHDYELAVEYGATIVRLGTVLFGPRQY